MTIAPSPRRALALVLGASFALSGCIPVMDPFDRPAPPPRDTPVLPPFDAIPPADSVPLTLSDGSPGRGLWCDIRSDCIDAARILCENRQSIRTSSDLDRASPGASEFLARSASAPHTLVVSCPV